MINTYRPSLGPEELQAVASVFDNRWLGLGPVTEQFERRLAEFLECKYVVGVGHGTAALHLALDVLGLGPGNEGDCPVVDVCRFGAGDPDVRRNAGVL